MFSRDQVLALMRERVHHPASMRELLQVLKVLKDDQTSFKRHVKSLVSSGELIQIRGNRFGLPEKMDLYVGRLQTNPAGYGFVVPRAEGRHLLAGTWGSNKWPDRAPADVVLLRGYVGGVGREAVLEADDDGLVHLVRAELGALAGIRGTPVHREVHRYPGGMPQYTVGHLGRVARIRGALAGCPGLAVTGAAYGGVGVPDCIADAQATARQVLASLG